MELGVDKAGEYILALKEADNFTFEDISNLSCIPLQKIKNNCSVKMTDPYELEEVKKKNNTQF